MSVTLEQFINSKLEVLSQTFNKVELDSRVSVSLVGNGVSESFLSSNTPLDKMGEEVDVSGFPNWLPFPNPENGTRVQFKVVPKGKRKPITLRYYFLWDEVK